MMNGLEPEFLSEVTEDAFLGGKIKALQPRAGYRAGIDALLLAASIPVAQAGSPRVLDAGSGVGVVGLCLAARVARARVVLVESEPSLVRLALRNVVENRLEDRIRVLCADITAPAKRTAHVELVPESFDHVAANPPFYPQGRARPARDRLRAGAHIMPSGGLERWVRAAARLARPGGTLSLVHRAEALGELLAAIGPRFGALKVLPIHPRADRPAIRVLVQGRKGSRAPMSLLPPLVLHGDGNRFLPAADAILRAGMPLDLDGD
jgi:tRNA1(Val) A37 N6-methylase TrmN6